MVNLFGGGSVINGAYPVYFHIFGLIWNSENEAVQKKIVSGKLSGDLNLMFTRGPIPF